DVDPLARELRDDLRVVGDAGGQLREVGGARDLVLGGQEPPIPLEGHAPQRSVLPAELCDDAGKVACVGEVLAQRHGRAPVRRPSPRSHRPAGGLEVTEAYPVLEHAAAGLRVLHRVGVERDRNANAPAPVVMDVDRQRRGDLAAREQQTGDDNDQEATHGAPSLASARAAQGAPPGVAQLSEGPLPASSTGGGSTPSTARKTISAESPSPSTSRTLLPPGVQVLPRVLPHQG